jgi:asparagine synthase (glutamine-hydrolysing)
MFAFALHEHDSGRVHLVRDRLGIKPLYMSVNGGNRIHFASSLPAMLQVPELDREIDPAALHHYLSFHAVVPAPRTIIRGVRKVPPATIVTIDADGRTREETFWQLDWRRDQADIDRSADEWSELVGEALQKAVSRRMVADVPVGVLLSGGIDSSLIVGLLAKSGQTSLNTFSIGFESVDDEAGDEFRYSDEVAKYFGTEHHRLYMNEKQVLAALPGAIDAMSEPMTSHDNVAFYLLAEQVKKHVKVVQSGQGADEVFGGYHWYPPLKENPGGGAADYARVFFDRSDEDVKSLAPGAALGGDASLNFIRNQFLQCGAESLVDKALHVDTTIMLPNDPVMRVDNMTMASGLEARVPFLDHELVQLAARIPVEHKLANGGKGVLRGFARGVIPDAVIDRPKGYFPVPALKYLRGKYLELVADALRSRAAYERGLFDTTRIGEMIDNPDEHITPLGGSSLWQVGLLEMWFQAHGI